jgi:Toprim-like/Protein of unknown function (DUF3991)
MKGDDFRRRAAVVRETPLETVLAWRHAERDRRDRSKWWTERGPVSITGSKFINWHQVARGGGAIDLTMHLAAVDCREAIAWLENQRGLDPIPHEESPIHARDIVLSVPDSARRELRLPARNDRLLDRVRQYLTERRALAASLLESLIVPGKLYADGRANAVFLLVMGKPNRAVGAELRGTGNMVWRGLAPGTRKDAGYFWIGPEDAGRIILCESAIDAISCHQFHPESICVSTSGARANPPWLFPLIDRGYAIHCGFDADGPGDQAASAMIASHPSIQRLRPPAHDWNDLLTSRV